ncbi:MULTISPECIES: TonB-dependent receptor [unclassified Dysgonomonas]|uniref:SusC/RagA family TonB-linked outer membrane protein n=1 Tax=unclassified Dysgonomonas TaxID=2630389 RepID=UPI0025C58847|nr:MULTISPECIES: TonB-dependent receptor [unclassified Dysgonomonas]HMM04970.1 TonB-dependent receptor [Dysgonomonas sp.]
MKKFLIICMSLIAFSLNTFAQETVEVTGRVTDAGNEPLIGVSVAVADAPGLGTITDVDGKYKIKLERYKKLVFSYIGFERQEVLINEQRVVDITMKEAESSVLKEIVVTGTGVQTKQTLTGAVSTVNMRDLKSNPTSSISNALAGNVPGIMAMAVSGQPGKNISEFWIRGISTFGGGSSALVLVDGFERDLNDINIEDIESFSVLKDASVTAIYGSKGANGVILITTKRGKSGKINIDVKVETTYNTRTITPEFVDGSTYASLLNESRITRNFSPIYQPEELEILRLGLDPDLYPNVDWKDLLLKDGAMAYRANMNMSGGGTTARYFVSVSYSDEGGMYKTDKALREDYDTNANYKRWNYRLNTDIDITKSTVLKVGVSGILSKRNSPGVGDENNNVWASLFGYSPIRTPVMYSNGYVPAVGTGGQTNPWVMATQTGFNENWENNIQTNVSLEQNFDFITKGLRFTGHFGFDTENSNNIQRRKWPEQWKAERSRNAQGELVFTHISDPSEMVQGGYSSGNRREFLDLMLNWDRGFNGHNVGGALKYTRDAFIKTVDLGTDIKNGVSRRNQGLAGRVTYNWNLRYFADFNFGYTGSENFAVGQQYGFFPAFSAGWNIAEEKFIKDKLEWMNMFKVRYSWGRVGNDNLGDIRFPYLYSMAEIGHMNDQNIWVPEGGYQLSDFGTDHYIGGLRYTQVASPYVTWEIATKNNLGFDLSLFGDKFQANVDFFDEKREGIYMARNFLPSMVGLESTPSANVGAVKSRGFDGRIEYRQKLGDVNLTVRGNMTYSKNEVLERDEENNVYAYQNQEGYRVDQAKGLISLGLFKDYDDIRNSPTQTFGTVQPGDIKYKDVNGDGIIDDGDQVAVGATQRPNLIYGAGISASWNGFDVNVHFQGAGKSTFFTYGKTVYAFSEGEWGTVLKDVMGPNRWIAADISGDPSTEDPNASYPRLSFGGNANNYRNSTFWLRNGAYLRLKTVDIGYTLPKNLTNRIHCNNIRVFLVGTNLLTWSKFKLWDPELATPRGEDYPLAKSITLGLSVNL